MDKGFLNELLLYLQQQRRQLDDSQRLLNDLQQQQGDIPSVSHITLSTHYQENGGGGVADDVVSILNMYGHRY